MQFDIIIGVKIRHWGLGRQASCRGFEELVRGASVAQTVDIGSDEDCRAVTRALRGRLSA